MEMTYFAPTVPMDVFFSALTAQAIEPLLPSGSVNVSTPKIKIPRSIIRSYTDSELATATTMMDRLRKKADVIDRVFAQPASGRVDQDRVLDAVVERLMDQLT